MNNINIKHFEQSIAEGMNQASHESAKDMLDRAMELGLEIMEVIAKYQSKGLPDVIIDGLLITNIQRRGYKNLRLAESLARRVV